MVEYIVAVLKFMVHVIVSVYTTLSCKGVIKICITMVITNQGSHSNNAIHSLQL